MNLFLKPKPLILTERLILRLPILSDYKSWVILRRRSEDFLNKWEPEKDSNYYSKTNFNQRVKWAKKNFNSKKVIHLFIFLQLYTASIFLEVYFFGERLHQKFLN